MKKKDLFRRIAVKIGTHVLTDENGMLDHKRVDELVRQVSEIRKNGTEVILITSGAVASGRELFNPKQKIDPVSMRQLLSSIGQIRLIQVYSSLFEKYKTLCSQVLVTREDFRSRVHYLNIKNCFAVLLNNGIIPIVNENDVVSVTELMFTDNDELAALVATMLNVDCLIILTTVEGIMKNREEGKSELIESVEPGNRNFEKHISSGKSAFGKGGMLTKAVMARKVAESGIDVRIANGKKDNILPMVLSGETAHTRFVPAPGKTSIKKWLQHSFGFEKGAVIINGGAVEALKKRKASSLLPVGIVAVEGEFQKGDLITIYNEKKQQVGLGIAQYNDEQARQKTGKQHEKPLIHYDYLFLL
jgi:glutamate 5-kinase